MTVRSDDKINTDCCLRKNYDTMDYKYYFKILVLLLVIFGSVDSIFNQSKKRQLKFKDSQGCFCKLQGEVDDCSCKVKSIDSLNNRDIQPRMNSLLSRNYFRYFKVNLNKECPFWADDSRCAMKNCAVDICTEEEVPVGVKYSADKQNIVRNTEGPEPRTDEDCTEGQSEESLGYLNTTITQESENAFKSWTKHDDAQPTFCEMDDDTSPNMQYVDLLLNPERYTGYKGESPHRIWNSIYKENCFKPEQIGYGAHSLSGMCLEKRTFYRLVSGLHTSINIHLCAQYLHPATTCYGREEWGPNIEEFQERFSPEVTGGLGPQRLKNLYFTYLVELRALAKVAPYLEQENFFTGDEEEDLVVKEGVADLLKVVKNFPDHFDESKLFQGKKKEVKLLKKEFQDHFYNISRIMDCVGCDKCKLWGKLQVQGMGTALKILFAGDGMGPQSTVQAGSNVKFQLRRTEIVSLFNAFGRLSKSISEIEMFRQRLES